MAVRYEDVLASMSPESQARIAEAAARLKADHQTFLELRDADASTRETPEFRAKLAVLPEEYRAELLRQEAERAGLDGLRKRVEALGGKLKITAEFPDGASLVIEEE